jgi:ribosomal protein L40E
LEFHPGRVLGLVLGLVILFTLFLLPFGSADKTLYGSVSPWLPSLGTVQSGSVADATYDYILVGAFVVLLVAGLVGIFPLATGALGVVGMGFITAAPYLVYPNGSPNALGTGVGFYVIWVASIASLGASFWHRKKRPAPAANVTATQAQTPESTAPAEEKLEQKCPNCGTMNTADAVQCRRCGYQFMKMPEPPSGQV